MSAYGYPRTSEISFPGLDFAPATILDTSALADRWAPWIGLTDSATSPVRARHAVVLLGLLGQGQEPHWVGMVSVTTARTQVLRQCRLDDHLCDEPEALPAGLRTGGWRELLHRLAHWPDQDIDDQTTIVALLTQLGFHRYVLRLVPRPAAGDRRSQQLAYEVARAGHQLNRMAETPFAVFGWLAANAQDPMLRLLAALQFVSNQVREHKNAARAGEWVAIASRLSDELTGPDWLVHLGRSRFHRAAALHHTLLRDVPAVASQMAAALRHDDALADFVTDEVRRHYQRENRRLVLEALVKLDTMAGTATAPVDALRQLALLDPFDPDPGFTIGALHESRGAWADAADAYLRAAAGGTVRGAHAAYQAGRCLTEIGETSRAGAAYRLCRDLDPAADVPLTPVDHLAGRDLS